MIGHRALVGLLDLKAAARLLREHGYTVTAPRQEDCANV
jgi:esterase/lipase